jgi:two-component system response regulator NreC
MAIRILVAQEHGVLRSALRALLERDPEFVVAGEVRNADELMDMVREHEADALILDCGMHRRCELGVLQEVLACRPELAVIVLGMCEDEPCIQRFFNTGVRGYILKTSAESELLNALRATCRGEFYIDSCLSGCIAVPPGRNGSSAVNPLSMLTGREQEVCRLLAYGYTNAEVAEKLAVSGRTVEAHRARIMAKLKLKNRADLVRFALYNGLMRAG